jgi:hypothetical protein
MAPDATRRPSGLKTAVMTHPMCFRDDEKDRPVALSHKPAVWSALAVTTRWPSGLNNALKTSCVCPAMVKIGPPFVAEKIRAIPSPEA